MLKWTLHCLLSSAIFLYLMITLWHSILFLWNGSSHSIQGVGVYETLRGSLGQEDDGMQKNGGGVLYSVVVDVLLISLFILQHSGMTSVKVKAVFLRAQFEHLYRSIYVLSTAAVLQILLHWWKGIPEVYFWSINRSGNLLMWWVFFLVHALAWIVLYGGCLMMDLPEIVGLKQVYYHGCAFESPLHLKSRELQTFYQHMRHPSFTALCCIFWFHPHMTLDRLLLATMLTFYMICRFAVDMNDYHYQKYQFDVKFQTHQIIKYATQKSY